MKELMQKCKKNNIEIRPFELNDTAYLSLGIDEWVVKKVERGLYTLRHVNNKMNPAGKYHYHRQTKKKDIFTASGIVKKIKKHDKFIRKYRGTYKLDRSFKQIENERRERK